MPVPTMRDCLARLQALQTQSTVFLWHSTRRERKICWVLMCEVPGRCSRCTGYRPILDAFRVFAKADPSAYTEEAIAASRGEQPAANGHSHVNGNGEQPANGHSHDDHTNGNGHCIGGGANGGAHGQNGAHGAKDGHAKKANGKSNGKVWRPTADGHAIVMRLQKETQCLHAGRSPPEATISPVTPVMDCGDLGECPKP